MSGDNRILNINGEMDQVDLLKAAIKIAFEQDAVLGAVTASHWVVLKEKGIIFQSSDYSTPSENLSCGEFPTPLDAEGAFELAHRWLQSPRAKEIECTGWDSNSAHDGHNGPGWRVYVEDWGHVGGCMTSICAIKPAFIWYGK